MNLFQTIILTGLIGNTVVGLFVLFSNPKRIVNGCFFCLSFLMMLWLGSMFFGSVSEEPMIVFWVRQTSALGGLVPLGVLILQIAITEPEITVGRVLQKLRYW